MRFLFTCIKSDSHFQPLLPLALGLKARGHDVRFAAIAPMAEQITRHGFPHLVMAGPSQADRDAFSASVRGLSGGQIALAYIPGFFMNFLPRAALPSLLPQLQVWRPDLIVREPTEFAGYLAAELLGIPHVRMEILNGASEEVVATEFATTLDALRRDVGLPALGQGHIRAEVGFTLHPPHLDGTTRLGTQVPFRFRPDPAPVPALTEQPDWLPRDGTPLIYATFGTVMANFAEPPPIYAQTVEALADLPVSVLLTVGRDAPDVLLACDAANIAVRRFVPQDHVLPHARLMLCHGGSGTVVAALAAGVPMVVTPFFADQPENAASVAAAGLGLAVPDADAAAIRRAVEQALGDEALHSRARAAAADIAGLPDLSAALDRLETLR